MASEKLLIVDDDTTLLASLPDYLEREGYAVQSADRGQAALRLFYEARPDLVVLDVMMPGMDGWEVCARVPELAETPVILLTAKTSEADKLRGFRLGVDDYITKPFSLGELRARVRAVLSRTSGQRSEQGAVLQVGALRVDLGRREATLEGRPLALTPTESRLLSALAAKPGQALSQAELVEEAWGAYRQETGSALRRYVW